MKLDIKKLKSYTGDLFYSILGLVVMNGVIQLLLYPFLTRKMGAENFGNALSLISVVAIMGTTFGVAANYSRVMAETKRGEVKGDYNIMLAFVGILSLFISFLGLITIDRFSFVRFGAFFLLTLLTILRYYSDVEFRLRTDYKGFFFFYLLISIGYCLGVALYSFTSSWIIAMLLGESFAVIYVAVKGKIYRPPFWERSVFFKENLKSFSLLSATELIAAVILNIDRLMLQFFSGGESVTVFYTATLLGKIISLLSMPLNGVIIGHLSRYKGELPKKIFSLICLLCIGLGLLLNLFCVGFSYIFVKIMYPDIFEQARPLFFIANASQVYYFASNTLTVILLRFTDEKYQLYINIIYLVIFFIIALPAVALYGMWGMASALLLVNLLKILVIWIIGLNLLKSPAEERVK